MRAGFGTFHTVSQPGCLLGPDTVRSTQSPVLLLACHCRPDMVPDTGGVTMYETLVYMEYDVIVGYDDDDDDDDVH